MITPPTITAISKTKPAMFMEFKSASRITYSVQGLSSPARDLHLGRLVLSVDAIVELGAADRRFRQRGKAGDLGVGFFQRLNFDVAREVELATLENIRKRVLRIA